MNPRTLLREFAERSANDWEELADAFKISTLERRQFEKGREPQELVNWLCARQRLHELPGAVEQIDRNDLKALAADLVKDLSNETVDRHGRTSQTLPIGILPELQAYLEASRDQYHAILDCLEDEFKLNGLNVLGRFHFVKFTDNFTPNFDSLAKILAGHIVRYSLKHGTRNGPEHMGADSAGHIYRKARDYFQRIPTSAEAGQLLLFFMLESVYAAPQIICKMQLKSSPQEEIRGSHGIHIRWDREDDPLQIYVGEARLYKDVGSAVDDALDNIALLNTKKGGIQHELSLVTAHFKFADERLRQMIGDYVDSEDLTKASDITHVCLIGFDWEQYRHLLNSQRSAVGAFRAAYKRYVTSMGKLMKGRFADYQCRHLRFEFIFLPFQDVDEFRSVFYRNL